MRAVQEREADVLRRFKVTPITPVPLLVASMIHGCDPLPADASMIMLLLAHNLYGMPLPPNLLSFFIFVCIGVCRFSLDRADHRRGRELVTGSEHPDPAHLHGDALPQRRDYPDLGFPELASNRYAIHSGDLSRDRACPEFCSAAKRLLQNWQIGLGAC